MAQDSEQTMTAGLLFQTFSRALRKICPNCGQAPMFKSFFKMHDKCPNCGVVYERENGEYVASMYLSIFITGLIFIFLFIVLEYILKVSLATQLWVLMPVIGLFPVWFYPLSKSIWAGVLYMMGSLYSD
jgi:uncharacterized protein (DUF983 family)